MPIPGVNGVAGMDMGMDMGAEKPSPAMGVPGGNGECGGGTTRSTLPSGLGEISRVEPKSLAPVRSSPRR